VIDESQQTSNESVGDGPVEPLTFGEKIRNIFSLEFAFAEGESNGDGGGDSGSAGESSTSDSSGSESTDSEGSSNDNSVESDSSKSENSGTNSDSVVSDSESGTSLQPEEININDENTFSGGTTENVFDTISIPGGDGIVVDDVIKDNIESLPDEEVINITTIEEIIPGVIEIYYSEEQIQKEIVKNLEWNFVASWDMVDIATPIDISGGKIFWFSRDKISLNEYNTNTGSISSQTVNPEQEVEVKYLEPNGDVSEITVDPIDLEITTPLEEETGVQTSAVPDFESEDSVKSESVESNSENVTQNNVE
jgi:hypothetical protein